MARSSERDEDKIRQGIKQAGYVKKGAYYSAECFFFLCVYSIMTRAALLTSTRNRSSV